MSHPLQSGLAGISKLRPQAASKHKPNTLMWVNPKELAAWQRGVYTKRPDFARMQTPIHTKLVKLILQPVSETPAVGKALTPQSGPDPLSR